VKGHPAGKIKGKEGKQMKRRSISVITGLMLSVLLLGGCGAGSDSLSMMPMTGGAASSAYSYDSAMPSEEMAEAGMEDSAAAFMAAAESRKIILRASFNVETLDYTESLRAVNEKIQETGSYIEYSDASGSVEDGTARTSMTIRVPSGSYGEFKAFVPEIGNVTYSSEGGEDVTSAYFDTDARLTALRAQEERVLELLEKAETMEDILAIESKLAELRYQIEQLTGELKRYDDLVNYATITLSLEQRRELTPVGEESFTEKLGRAMSESLSSLASLLENAVIALVWLVPYLLVLGVIAGVIFLIVWLSLRHGKKKAAKREEKR